MRHAPASPLVPAAFATTAFECACGTVHHSGDGKLPVGWSTAAGAAWCADCTRAGIPARELAAKPCRSNRRAA
jgi:hypothetical protein